MEWKLTFKSDNKAKKYCKVMILDETLKIQAYIICEVVKMAAAAVGPRFRSYFVLKFNISLRFYCNA
jgi:hypothetical protein